MNKPQVKNANSIDLFDMLYWCEQYRNGIKKRVLDYYQDHISNDISVWLDFTDEDEEFIEDEVIKADFALIRQEFPCVNESNIIFDICW